MFVIIYGHGANINSLNRDFGGLRDYPGYNAFQRGKSDKS